MRKAETAAKLEAMQITIGFVPGTNERFAYTERGTVRFAGESWTEDDVLTAHRLFHPADALNTVPCGPAGDRCDGGKPAYACRFHRTLSRGYLDEAEDCVRCGWNYDDGAGHGRTGGALMFRPMQRQFVEVAAQTIRERTRAPGCLWCGWGGKDDATPLGHEQYAAKKGFTKAHLYEPHAAEPQREEDRLAAYLLGAVETANGATIEGIVTAARQTMLRSVLEEVHYRAASDDAVASKCSCVCHSDDAMCEHCAETCAVGAATCKAPTPEHPARTICHNRKPCHEHPVNAPPFDAGALFRAIARESLGQGTVADEFGEIRIPHRAICCRFSPESHCMDGGDGEAGEDHRRGCGRMHDHAWTREAIKTLPLTIPRLAEGATS